MTIDLGPLGIGTAPLGGMYEPVSDDQAHDTLLVARSLGITLFDTAPHYGRGLAERRLGRMLAETETPDDRVVISTKVGRFARALDTRADDDIFVGAPPGESVFDFRAAAIRRQLDESLERLGRDRVEIALIHDPEQHLDHALDESLATLRALRDEGLVGAVGVGTNVAATAHRFLDTGAVDVILLAGRITLLEDSGVDVAARCAATGVRLLAGGVLQSGILAGPTAGSSIHGHATYDYAPAPPPIVARVEQLAAVCARHDVALATAAIAHAWRVPGVTTVVVGARRPDEVSAAVDALAVTLDDEFWAELDELRASSGP